MTIRQTNNIFLFSLFGVGMWFFGNLYECIVIGPNMLSDSVARLTSFQDFFITTNQIYYYVPIPILAVISVVFIYFKTPKQDLEIKGRLKLASILLTISIILSTYIIAELNFKLFFGDIEKYANVISSLTIQWNILNIIRTILVGTALLIGELSCKERYFFFLKE